MNSFIVVYMTTSSDGFRSAVVKEVEDEDAAVRALLQIIPGVTPIAISGMLLEPLYGPGIALGYALNTIEHQSRLKIIPGWDGRIPLSTLNKKER